MTGGWVRMEEDWWEATAAALTSSGQPWPEEAILMDLRWWDDQARMKGRRRPGRPSLCKRWNREDGGAVRRIMSSESAWSDSHVTGQSQASDRPATGQRPASSDGQERQESTENGQRPASDRPATGQRPAPRAILMHDHDHDHIHGESTREAPPSSPEPAAPEEPVSAPTPVAQDLPSQILEEILGVPVQPTAPSAPVTSWLALPCHGTANAEELLEQVRLVAAAGREAPGAPWADELRAEGWRGRQDWSRRPRAVLDPGKWGERLALARAWDASGRPGRGGCSTGQLIAFPEPFMPPLPELPELREEPMAEQGPDQEAVQEAAELAELLVALEPPVVSPGDDLRSRAARGRRAAWLRDRDDLALRLQSADLAALAPARAFLEGHAGGCFLAPQAVSL